MNNFPCPLLHKWMMTSPLIIQWCCINLTAEYPHFFPRPSSPYPTGLFPFSSLPPPQIPPHTLKENGALFLATAEAAWAGNAQQEQVCVGVGECQMPLAFQATQRQRCCPAASVPTPTHLAWGVTQHGLRGRQSQHPPWLSRPCPAFVVFRKVVYLFAFDFISLLWMWTLWQQGLCLIHRCAGETAPRAVPGPQKKCNTAGWAGEWMLWAFASAPVLLRLPWRDAGENEFIPMQQGFRPVPPWTSVFRGNPSPSPTQSPQMLLNGPSNLGGTCHQTKARVTLFWWHVPPP